jgi:hypothetical protein
LIKSKVVSWTGDVTHKEVLRLDRNRSLGIKDVSGQTTLKWFLKRENMRVQLVKPV